MNFEKWQKLNEAINFTLGMKTPGVFFINSRGEGQQVDPEAAAEPAVAPQEDGLFAQTEEEIKADELQDFNKSFEEYFPFQAAPKIGTKEFEDAFDKSLEDHGYQPGQKHSDGMAAEDVLLAPAKEDEVMPVVNNPAHDPAQSAPPVWDRTWQQFDWQDGWSQVEEPKN